MHHVKVFTLVLLLTAFFSITSTTQYDEVLLQVVAMEWDDFSTPAPVPEAPPTLARTDGDLLLPAEKVMTR